MEDQIAKIYQHGFMDSFHDYGCRASLWRYQHRQRVRVIEEILAEGKTGKDVGVDAGAGKGPNSVLLAGAVSTVYAFEYDEKELARLRKNLASQEQSISGKVIAKQVDLQSIPLEDASADTVVCSEVLEHVPDYNRAMAEISRICKKDAVVIFSMPNILSLFWQHDRLFYFLRKFVRRVKGKDMPSGGYSYWEQSRHWAFTSKDIRQLCTSHGFQIQKEIGVGPLVFNNGLLRFLYRFKLLPRFAKLEEFIGKKNPRICPVYFLVLTKDSTRI